jgi:hypothetical protein
MKSCFAGLLTQAQRLSPRPETIYDLAYHHFDFLENVRKARLLKPIVEETLGIQVPQPPKSVYSGLSESEIIQILRKHEISGPNMLDRRNSGLYHYCLKDKRSYRGRPGNGIFWERIYRELGWTKTAQWKSVRNLADLEKILDGIPDFLDHRAYDVCRQGMRMAGIFQKFSADIVQPLLEVKKKYATGRKPGRVSKLTHQNRLPKKPIRLTYIDIFAKFMANQWRRLDDSKYYALLSETLSPMEKEAFKVMIISLRDTLSHKTREIPDEILLTVVRMFNLHRLSPNDLDRAYPTLAHRMRTQRAGAFWRYLYEEWQCDLNLVPSHNPTVWPSPRMIAACAENQSKNLPKRPHQSELWALIEDIQLKIDTGTTRIRLAETLQTTRSMIEKLRSIMDLPLDLRSFLQHEVCADWTHLNLAKKVYHRELLAGKTPDEATADTKQVIRDRLGIPNQLSQAPPSPKGG